MVEYIIKSTLCLGVLYMVYRFLFGKARLFVFNRFFLLGSLAFGLLFPLIDIPVYYDQDSSIGVKNLSVINWRLTDITYESTVDQQLKSSLPRISLETLFILIYISGCFLMLIRFIRNLQNLMLIRRNGRKIHFNGHSLILCKEGVAPFSFLNEIFLEERSFHQQKDTDLVRHEGAHIRQGHSYDILFIEMLLIFYWFQPFIYLFRKAMVLNHEFIADDEVTSGKNYQEYLYKILTMTNHPIPIRIVNHFSFISIKNRIKMMNKKKPSKKTVILKSMLVIVIMIGLFAFNLKPILPFPENQKLTIILDAGHGGSDNGAVSSSGVQEKAITLAIVQALKRQLEEFGNISIFQTRQEDRSIVLADRILKTGQADLFLSIHVSTHAENDQLNDKQILYSVNNPHQEGSQIWAQSIAQMFEFGGMQTKIEKADYYVLKNADCPALLINVGFLSNNKDVAYLESVAGQEEIADRIAQSISLARLWKILNHREKMLDSLSNGLIEPLEDDE